MAEVICPYCGAPALRVTGRDLHPQRPDLADKHFHMCRDDDAWVGCRPGTWEPSGRLANAALRKAKKVAFAAIEPLVTRAMSQQGWAHYVAWSQVNRWLASEMNLGIDDVNIGFFDVEQCELATLICTHREPSFPSPSKDAAKLGFRRRN